jgi:hypothetical protein
MDQAEQSGEFAAGKPALVVSPPPASPPMTTSQNGTGSHLQFANVLVWVLRGLALVALVWGVMNVVNAWRWSHVAREFRARQGADVLEAVESTAVFGTVIFAVASVAVLLALSECLRICVLIERNTWRAEESQPLDKASTWLARL